MIASVPDEADKRNEIEITRKIFFKLKLTDYNNKLTLETGEVIASSVSKKPNYEKIELLLDVLETDHNDLTSMRYYSADDVEHGWIHFYIALKTEKFEKFYNEIALGIIPKHVDIDLPIGASSTYEDSPIKFGNGDGEYFWQNVNQKVVKLDKFEFQYARQKPNLRRISRMNLYAYAKSHKIEMLAGIAMIIYIVLTAWR